MWQIMWKLRKTSTKWKKTAKNAIFVLVLVDTGCLNNSATARLLFVGALRPKCDTGSRCCCTLQFVSKYVFTLDDSSSLWVICGAFARFVFICFPFLRQNLTFGAHYCPIFEPRHMICKLTRAKYQRHFLNMLSFVKSEKFADQAQCWFSVTTLWKRRRRFLHNFNCEQGKPFPAKRKHLKWIPHHLPNDQQIECLGVERI